MRAFLRRARDQVGPSGNAIIGVDLRKSVEVLIAAYDDAKGVTALFNLNLLTRINRELGGTFAIDSFEHRVKWNERESAIEMHLVSMIEQTVRVAGHDYHFDDGESVHTESSRKYETSAFTDVCERNGWRLDRLWLDDEHRFAVFGLV